MQTLALTSHDARRWEPKRLRHRLFSIPASIARSARQTLLHLSDRALGRGRRRRHPQTRPVAGARLTRPPAAPTSRTTRTRGTPHPVTTTGQLSYPHDRIRPTR